jgi:saccharopepsin
MMNAQIGATKSWNGQYTVDCAKVPDLPELSFYFGGQAYPLKGTDYILEVQGTCMSAFTGLDINLPGGSLWIIGMSRSQMFLMVSINLTYMFV